MVAQYDPLQFSLNPRLDWDGSPEHELALDMTYSGGGRCQTDELFSSSSPLDADGSAENELAI